MKLKALVCFFAKSTNLATIQVNVLDVAKKEG